MSRAYAMQIDIHGIPLGLEEAIKATIEDLWTISEWNRNEVDVFVDDKAGAPKSTAKTLYLNCYGEDSLCGGASEEEFAARVRDAVWKITECFSEISVIATYLEDLPYETYTFDEDDYEKWKKKN